MKGLFRENEGDICRLTKTYLELFRESFMSTKVSVLDDALLYHSIPIGFSETMITQAKELIEKMKLNLEVVSNERAGLFKDTFRVEYKKIDK